MRIRHKRADGLMFEVDDESATHYLKRTGICEGTKDAYFTGYFKADYEPIPDERWIDVTGACTLNEAKQSVFLAKEGIAGVRSPDYRFVREQLFGEWYLRMERKQPA